MTINAAACRTTVSILLQEIFEHASHQSANVTQSVLLCPFNGADIS